MASANNKEKRRQSVMSGVLNLLRKGKISNDSAKQFIDDTSLQISNMDIIYEISKLVSQLGPLNNVEESALTEIFNKYKLPITTQVSVTQNPGKHQTLFLNEHLKITDLSPADQENSDEYDFIFNKPICKRLYLLESTETIGNCTVTFSNFLFGNLTIDENSPDYDKKSLISTFSRKNVVQAILNDFGFISTTSSSGCSSKYQNEMFNKLIKFQPQAKFNRIDGSRISILKIGSITLARPNKLEEYLDQYLISSNSRLFLSYGKINFELLEISPHYQYQVANFLLGYTNLNSSSYIGSLKCNSIIKLNVPFGKAATSGIKTRLKVAL